MNDENGKVSVLLSGNYNNFQCQRPLPPGASDETYREEFNKAIELCQDALGRNRSIEDTENRFEQLRQEYWFLKNWWDTRCARTPDLEAGPPMSEAEYLLFERLQMYDEKVMAGHKDRWQWQNLLDVENGDEDQL